MNSGVPAQFDPSIYEKWRGSVLGRTTDALERKLILDLVGNVAGLTVIDVGCGDGELAVELWKRGAKVTGVDTSPSMIEAARERAARRGIEVTFEVATAQALPFPLDTFDAAVAVTVLCFIEEEEPAFREIARVLRPGGRLVVGELGRWSTWAVERRVRSWLGSSLWRQARFRTGTELRALAGEAGFVIQELRGAIYYPRCGLAARLFGPVDRHFSRLTILGAAFLALAATKRQRNGNVDWRRNLSTEEELPPILAEKHYGSPSAFTPESLLREARRQKSAGTEAVPDICLLDPDGDIVRQLKLEGRAKRHDGWVCYHTDLFVFEQDGFSLGVVGCAVGASFAVLVAEELFASGCKLLISVTSSGQIMPVQAPPYFIMIDRALRDEGTSYHYLPPSSYSEAPETLVDGLDGAFDDLDIPVLRGATWTTDAPFRETDEAIESMRQRGLLAVEMEAAALYAFARARGKSVVCFAHVTNQMGRIEGDFEKGHADGATDALRVVVRAAQRFLDAGKCLHEDHVEPV